MTQAVLEKKVERLVRKNVLEVVGALLDDPDFGLAFRKRFAAKLERSIRDKKRGALYSLHEVERLLA